MPPAWQVTGIEFFRTITEEILDYVVREMLDPGGEFYSIQDADSEGEEGKFFVWTPDQIREGLGSNANAFVAGLTNDTRYVDIAHRALAQMQPI
jgi:uncharacterized protein YyaL (SSP411 family)